MSTGRTGGAIEKDIATVGSRRFIRWSPYAPPCGPATTPVRACHREVPSRRDANGERDRRFGALIPLPEAR